MATWTEPVSLLSIANTEPVPVDKLRLMNVTLFVDVTTQTNPTTPAPTNVGQQFWS